jgi:hypothetical protein
MDSKTRFLAVLLAGLVVFSASATALEYFRLFVPSGGYGSFYHPRYVAPTIGPSAGSSATTTVSTPVPQTKDVTVRVKDWGGKPVSGALVKIYAQVGLGIGELRGSGYTGSDGKVVIPDISFKWHVIQVTAPGKPIRPFHYLPPGHKSDTIVV